jgi:Tfp pilus assembly protein PilF
MQPATEETVLGDFDGATVTHHGVTSTFFRRDGKFWVRTDGPDGELRDYEIVYTFGVRPLQQYLIEFPGGRLQALGLCWDARPAEQGGQAWFHIYSDEPVPHGDPLHWTGRNQNWNYMCADCHSTNLRKNYSLAEDRFDTTWSEIDVSCEACHGPGSRHVAWASAGAADSSKGLVVDLGDSDGGRWVMDRDKGIARRSVPRSNRAQIETCAPCHARRSLLSGDYVQGHPLADTHRPALLEAGLYHADGQILEEVYEYGSFLQSKMYREGVTCTDCHDPHSLKLNGSGNAPCAGCHLAAKYDTASHHFHDPASAAGRCTACHMPRHVYMVVDPRFDHSFRVPRPDLTQTLGSPNACNACHADRTPRWAAERIAEWRGPGYTPPWHYGEALYAGRTGSPDAERALTGLVADLSQPAIVRATALEALPPYAGAATAAAVQAAVGDDDPVVRAAALETATALAPEARLPLAAPLLSDPVRLVRIAAARLLTPPPQGMTAEQLSNLEFALSEYVAGQLATAERAESHVNLGTLYAELGQVENAERSFETAMRIDPGFIPAYVNSADLYRSRGQEERCEQVLRRALQVAPDDGDVHHALGLALVRQRRFREAIAELEIAARRLPNRARYAYALGVALNDQGQTARAIEVLAEAHARHPADRDLLYALATIEARNGETEAARVYATKLLAISPDDPGVRQLVQQLQPRRP